LAFPTTQWYVNSVGYAAITQWATGTVIAAGALRRQLAAPSTGNERIFVAIVAGTTHATTEPTWTVTRGAKTTDNTVTWQECTGQAAVNGDITNTVDWNSVKNTAVSLGVIIKNVAASHYFICSTAGTAGNGSEPSWGTTAGNTTVDNGATWTCIGAVGSFTGGLAPHICIANAIASTWAAAGERVCVGDNHAYSRPSAIVYAGSSATPFYVICHNHSGNYPPTSSDLTTGATETVTGGSQMNYTAQAFYVSGVEFNNNGTNSINLGNVTNPAGVQRFVNCKFTSGGSAVSPLLGSNANSSAPCIYMTNCTFKFASVGQAIQPRGANIVWENSTALDAAGSIPTTLIIGANSSSAFTNFLIRGVDLSALGSGKNLVGSISTAANVTMLYCKLGASVSVYNSNKSPTCRVHLIDCDSGATNYRNELYDFSGTMTTETTIVRASGASDGTRSLARKIVTTSSALIWQYPFETPTIPVWNETVGSAVTVTLYGIWGGGAVPNNDEFWIEVAYQGSTLSPAASFSSSGKADFLASNSPLSADGSNWGGSTTPFKTSVTITPQQKGYIFVTPKMAKASTTLYYDNKVVLS